MKSTVFLVFTICFFTNTVNAQITKGNWLVGGNANFSSSTFSNTIAASYTQTNIQISPNTGYFFMDKFAGGLKLGYSYSKSTLGSSLNNVSSYLVGPFIRYYLLNTEKRINIFSEATYQYTSSKTGNNASNSYNLFSFSAGPVVYFNSSVGLEFLVGYSTAKYSYDANSTNNTVQIGIGLQVHLEKDK